MRPDQPKFPSTQRAGITCELPPLLAELGVPVSAVFEGSGIDPATLTPDTRVLFDAGRALLRRAAIMSGCPHLGLLLGLRFRLDMHGPIGRLMRTAPTLNDALIDFVTWQPGYSSGAAVYLLRWENEVGLCYGVLDFSAPGTRELYDCVAGVAIRLLEQLTEGRVRPDEIHLAYRAPEDVSPYAKLLGVNLRFDRDQTCIVIGKSDAGMALPGTDPGARASLFAGIESGMKPSLTAAARVRQKLRPMLQMGQPSMGHMAEDLGIHPRTLRRRLAEEGATFEALRDEIRFAIARELLEMTNLPVADISAAISFAAPGIFTDAFRSWTGMTPVEWRRSATRSRPPA
jgi:AraC-like DNA-binding protein